MAVLTVLFGLVLLGVAAANSEQDLFDAARDGNVDFVRQAIAEGTTDINWNNPDDSKDTALMTASSNNHIKIVKLLLDAGAIVDKVNMYGDFALLHATMFNNLEVAKILLEAGAPVDQRTRLYGNTALREASLMNRIELVKLLLDAGATVDQGNEKGTTALITATGVGHIEVVKLLLNAGATVDLANNVGHTALHWAAFDNNMSVAQVLLQNGAKVTKLAADAARQKGYNELADYIDGYSHATTSAQELTSPATSASHLALFIKIITREIFLAGPLMAMILFFII